MLLTAWENEQALIEKKEKEVSGRPGAHRAGLPPGPPAPRLRGAGSRASHAFRFRLPPKGICCGPGPPHCPQNTSELVPVKERGLALVPLLCIAS